jgi:hypothetical protein
MSDTDKHAAHKSKDLDAILAIGVFLGLFGLAVISAVFFTNTYHGKVVNLASGVLLLIISLLAILHSRNGKKKK